MTKQRHMYNLDPAEVTAKTEIIAVNDDDGSLQIAVKDNLMRASGGGEPRDLGIVSFAANDDSPVRDVIKKDGLTWMAIDDGCRPQVGESVVIRIDGGHRDRRRRLHTGVHLFLRSVYEQFSDARVRIADIDPSAKSAIISASVEREVNDVDVWDVDRRMRSFVLSERPVTAIKAKSLEAAEAEWGALLRVSDRHSFKGRVRLIHIEGVDLNPCSGLHHTSSNIGPYSIDRMGNNVDEIKVELRLCDCWMYWFGG